MSNVKNKKNQLRAVIYARYSDDNQRVESIEGQIRECTEFANEQGYTLVGTYADKARTGKTEKLVQFQKIYLTLLAQKNSHFSQVSSVQGCTALEEG